MRFQFEIKLACFLFALLLLLLVLIYLFPPGVQELYTNISHLPLFEDIKDQFSTGDLIFLTGNTYGEKMIRWGTGSPWTHVGMVVVKSDKHNDVWLWECDIGQGFKSGVRLIPLDIKLKKWRHGKRIGGWIKSKLDIDYSHIESFIRNEEGKGIETKYYSYLISKLFPSRDSNKFYCSELIVRTYQYLDLISQDVNAKSISPNDFFNRKVGTKLDRPILFRF